MFVSAAATMPPVQDSAVTIRLLQALACCTIHAASAGMSAGVSIMSIRCRN